MKLILGEPWRDRLTMTQLLKHIFHHPRYPSPLPTTKPTVVTSFINIKQQQKGTPIWYWRGQWYNNMNRPTNRYQSCFLFLTLGGRCPGALVLHRRWKQNRCAIHRKPNQISWWANCRLGYRIRVSLAWRSPHRPNNLHCLTPTLPLFHPYQHHKINQPLVTPRTSTSHQFSNARPSYSPAYPRMEFPESLTCPLTDGHHIRRAIKPPKPYPPIAYPTPVLTPSSSVDGARKYEACLTSTHKVLLNVWERRYSLLWTGGWEHFGW